MPANFFTIAWPLAFIVIVMAAIIVSLAAIATTVTVFMRARQLSRNKGSQAPEEADVREPIRQPSRMSSLNPDPWDVYGSEVAETLTTDGVHYIPIL